MEASGDGGNGTALANTWKYLWTDLADPRTSEWPLMSSPLPVFAILGFYNLFCQKLGPALMANRKPFRLERTLIVYNAVQVVVSCFLFYQACRLAWLRDYSWRCQPVDYSTSPRALEIAASCYFYFVAKLTELLDTVFFVLRKKERQVSFLHLYHHTVMPIISWGCVKFMAGGHGTFIGFINCFVHIVMYTYYLLAAAGFTNLWWKKYVTRLQLIQFCVAFAHSAQLCFYDCGFPRFTMIFTLPNTIYFYYLFKDFYNKAYDSDEPSRGELPPKGKKQENNNEEAKALLSQESTSLKAKCD